MAQILLTESAAPSTPSTGKLAIYAKTDGKIYTKNDAGTEVDIGSTGGIANVVEDTTPQLGGPLDAQGNDITSGGVVFLTEQAAAEADVAGQGQLWVKTATPNQLWFTDDAGTDFQLASLAGTETLTNKTLTSPVLNTGVSGTAVLDEDNMATNSDTQLATQQSIKAYADTKAPIASPTFTGTVTLPTGLTGVIRADTGVVSVDTDVTDIVSAASTTAAGKVEIAIASEVNTGTDATRAVSPDSLAGSNLGTKVLEVTAFDYTTDTAVGDGAGYVTVPSSYAGMDLVAVHARVITAGTTGTTDIQIHNLTQTADMLTTKITIDSTETGSDTAVTAAVIDTANDDVAAYDLLRIDVDAVSTTAAKGLIVTLEFRLP